VVSVIDRKDRNTLLNWVLLLPLVVGENGGPVVLLKGGAEDCIKARVFQCKGLLCRRRARFCFTLFAITDVIVVCFCQ
jgi:hypothetical protein